MGGQACVLYGAAEFSRDTDIAILASSENCELLKSALRTLQAHRIAVPPFELSFLQKGHAIHFRCYHPEVFRIRIDVMSVMRGVDVFEKLWERRARIMLPTEGAVELLSLPDLVRAKKTQRDKDWPMIRRLIDAEYVGTTYPSDDKVEFWLMESRTPRMLVELAQRYKQQAAELVSARSLLAAAIQGNEAVIEDGLAQEQMVDGKLTEGTGCLCMRN